MKSFNNKAIHNVIDAARVNIKSKGFYDAIFTPQFEELDVDDKNLVVGVIMGDYGLNMKDLIDNCIEEKLDQKPISSLDSPVNKYFEERSNHINDISKSISFNNLDKVYESFKKFK